MTLAWQVAFLIISTDPVRFRPLMIAAVLEKGVYLVTLTVLYLQGRLEFGQFAVISPDGILCVLFIVAFLKTPQGVVATSSRAVSA